jgi:hypothetical protein
MEIALVIDEEYIKYELCYTYSDLQSFNVHNSVFDCFEPLNVIYVS